MPGQYLVKATFPNGEVRALSSCCERDAVGRFMMLGSRALLEQPASLPRACEAHRYDPEASR